MGRKKLLLVGVFSTCCLSRSKTICTTVVRLLKSKGAILWVRCLVALEGSPLIDLEPLKHCLYPLREEIKIAP